MESMTPIAIEIINAKLDLKLIHDEIRRLQEKVREADIDERNQRMILMALEHTSFEVARAMGELVMLEGRHD